MYFYGHDSGWFPELTWNWLVDKPLDIIVLECTYGLNGDDRTDNHMSLETVFAAKQNWKLKGVFTRKQKRWFPISRIAHAYYMKIWKAFAQNITF